MAAPTAQPIVTKLGLQMLNITSLKLIPPHLTFEAVLRPKSRSKSRSKVPHCHISQAIDGLAIGIGQPLGNNCAGPVLSAGIYGKRRGGKKVSRGGDGARMTRQANMRLDPETHGLLPSLSWGVSEWGVSGSASFNTRNKMDPIRVQDQLRGQDQLRVEHETCAEREARVELWSSLLDCGESYNNPSNVGHLC